MRFGPVPVDEAEGALLAHSLSAGSLRFAKGHRLDAADVAAARAAGIVDLVVARLDPGDVAEDEAAVRIGRAVAGTGIVAGAPVHGRVNLSATADGLLRCDGAAVAALNLIDEAVTLGTLPPLSRVRAGEIVATVKIIPYAAAETSVTLAQAAGEGLLSLAPFRPTAVELIHTMLPGLPDKLIAKTSSVIQARLAPLSGGIVREARCRHEEAALAAQLVEGSEAGIILIAAASATVDRRDVVPGAIIAAGGMVERLGMPVDPGNLLCLGLIGGRIVIGLPGCARSPKRNGIDLVLERLMAGMVVDGHDIALMGVGGLLADSNVRPEPRGASARPRSAIDMPALTPALTDAAQHIAG
ncbi:MAG: molybdopterin-binding protein [Sphingobium sp.]|uniref:molybdopterin-binding protein n=1 Tax=Sphingobium sp. TaxID=1912891 RepID=UPI002E2138B8